MSPMLNARRIRTRVVFCQVVLFLGIVAGVFSYARYHTLNIQFSPGFLPVWPGGESFAYDEFAQTSGKKVAFLGNSVMLGADFVRMNKVVRRHYGDVTLFNFGRPGASIADYRVMLARLGSLKPDLVVLQLHDVSVGEGNFNGVHLPEVFHTNVKGEVTRTAVLSRLGPGIFWHLYGLEGFFQSLLYRLHFLSYRDTFRRIEWGHSRGLFNDNFQDTRSKVTRYAFQGVGPAFKTAEQEDKPTTTASLGGYPGLTLDSFQCSQFELLLDDLNEMKIPYFIYLQPVPPKFADGSAVSYLRNTLRKRGVPFVDLRDSFPVGEFTDAVHLRNSRHLFELMFATSSLQENLHQEIPWEQIGLRTEIQRGFECRRLGDLAAINLEGGLRKRDYFLFVDRKMVRVSPGTPLLIEKEIMEDYAAGKPVVLDDLRKTYWGLPSTLSRLEAVHIVPGEPGPRDGGYFQNLRFVSVSIPAERIQDVFAISVNRVVLAELGSLEASMNVGYWYTDGMRILLILPNRDPIASIDVSYMAVNNDLGRLLTNAGGINFKGKDL